jgi:hypothetical protein
MIVSSIQGHAEVVGEAPGETVSLQYGGSCSIQ